ncbi:MAG: hypothetical protein QM831_27160 [Kofleriaceae bacterium]
MGKPPGLSEGSYESPNIDQEQDMVEHGANPKVARIVYAAVILTCVVLAIVMMIGHRPTGG